MSQIVKAGVACGFHFRVMDQSVTPAVGVEGLTVEDMDFEVFLKAGNVDKIDEFIAIFDCGDGIYFAEIQPLTQPATYGCNIHAVDYDVMAEETFQVTYDGLAQLTDIAVTIAAAVRADMDGYSTKLAHLDVDISTRLAAADYTPPPTVEEIREEMDDNSSDLDGIGSLATSISGRLPAALVGGRMDSKVGDLAAGVISEAAFGDEAISDRVLAADVDTYQAKVVLVDDDSGAKDRYIVTWFKNAQPLFSGVTTPTLRVRDLAADGDLIAETAMVDDDEGDFSFDEPTARIDSGKKYQAIVTAEIDGLTRRWKQPVGRDTI